MNPLFFGFFFLISSASLATERTVTVSGECALEVEADRGSVVLVADYQDKDAKIAIRKATELHEKVKSDLKKSKVKNLELSSVEYSVQEITAWEDNKSVSKGFQCRIGIKAVTSDISGLGEILAIAAEDGIRTTSSLQTYLSDSKTLEEKKKCLGIAVKNAREKAEFMVKSLNAKLGSVQTILERTGQEPRPGPIPKGFAMRAAEAAPDASIEAGKQSVHHEVDVTFAVEL
jgi:uncharacterized protein YggE